MRLSLTGLFRIGLMMGLGLFLLSVALGQLSPSSPAYWRAAQPPFEAINGFIFGLSDRMPCLLDLQNGTCRPMHLPSGDTLEYASCSPWRDEEGGSQIVGRWSSRVGGGNENLCVQMGIGRLRVPDGEVLDRVESEIIPLGRPCWYPTPPARVLFEAGDGQLYRVAFPDEPGEAGPGGVQPEPILWGCEPPGAGRLILGDPVWVPDPRWGGYLLVALNHLEKHGSESAFVGSRLWWLRLGRDGRTIEAAGPLAEAPREGRSNADRADERFPNVVRTPDGTLALVYLARPRGHVEWELRTIALRGDRPGGRLFTGPEPAKVLSDDCLPVFLAASPDGRWIHAVRQPPGRRPRIERILLASATDAQPGSTPRP